METYCVMIFGIVIVDIFAEIHFWTNTRTLIFQTRFRCARSRSIIVIVVVIVVIEAKEKKRYDKQFHVVHTMEENYCTFAKCVPEVRCFSIVWYPVIYRPYLSWMLDISANVHLTHTRTAIEWNNGKNCRRRLRRHCLSVPLLTLHQ